MMPSLAKCLLTHGPVRERRSRRGTTFIWVVELLLGIVRCLCIILGFEA